jgi:transposase, IS5 family
MKGKPPDQSSLNLFEPVLRQVVKRHHPLVLFADNFPWNDIESEYSVLYSEKGAPSKPVRLMAGLLILKQIFKGTDEGMVLECARDDCFQYFCGGSIFNDKPPCDPSDLARFRKRIGRERLSRLMELSSEAQARYGVERISIKTGTRPGPGRFCLFS